MDFSVQIINLAKNLKAKLESLISNQIGRTNASIGANIQEAKYVQGKKDFVSKREIAAKKLSKPAIGSNFGTRPTVLMRCSSIA